MNSKKSIAVYFSVVLLLVVLSYGLKNTFAYFVANQNGTAADIKIAKLVYYLDSDDLDSNETVLKPFEVKKIKINLTSDYDIATVYRLFYEGNVVVEKASTSADEVKSIVDAKSSKNIDLVITNNTNEEQAVKFYADGGYVGNDLEDGNITKEYDENILINHVLINGSMEHTKENEYRDLNGTNNYINVDDTTYRIIGVFTIENERYLKVITEENIGKQLFGETNNYLTSSLNDYLNVDYKDTLPMLIKSSIKEVDYYIGGTDKVLDKDYYNIERNGEKGISSIGLMYLSDYEYASNWIKKDYKELTIVPNTSDDTKVFCIDYDEENMINSGCSVSDEAYVRPVMYLDNKLEIISGTGEVDNPFILK